MRLLVVFLLGYLLGYLLGWIDCGGQSTESRRPPPDRVD